MTIRIHEADGTPYEHVLDIRTPFKRYEVPFNTKYKRVRRNTKRYLARQAAAQAAAEGDAEAAEAMGMIDMGFGLDIWEKEKERENWKVADWTEDDEQVMSGATYEWIRMDADFEWIATIEFTQPDFMWVSQLQRDRDVVAQLEVGKLFTPHTIWIHSILQAVRALSKMSNAIVSSTFTKTVLVTNYFYRVRCEAALALVTVCLAVSFICICSYLCSAPINNLISWAYSIYSSSFSDTVMIRTTLNKIFLPTRMCQGRTTSLTSRSTSYEE